jgi:hypothetical protein
MKIERATNYHPHQQQKRGMKIERATNYHHHHNNKNNNKNSG